MHLGAERDERGPQARRVYESRRAAAKDRVITIFATGRQTSIESITLAEIPAARPLAEIAADSAHVADLRAGDPQRGFGQRWILAVNRGARCQLINGYGGADVQAGWHFADAAELLDTLDVHNALGAAHVVLHQADEVRSARQDFGVVPA